MVAQAGHPGFWFGLIFVALALWNLHRGTRRGGVYRWMFPNDDDAKDYGMFSAANMVLLAVGAVLVILPFAKP